MTRNLRMMVTFVAAFAVMLSLMMWLPPAVDAATIEHPTRQPAGGGADTKLSNVAGTAVSDSLLPATDDNNINLGSLTKRWGAAWVAKTLSVGTNSAASNYQVQTTVSAASAQHVGFKNASTSSAASMDANVVANDNTATVAAYGSTYTLDATLTNTVILKGITGRVFVHGGAAGGTVDLLSTGTDGDTPDVRVQADHSLIILKQFTTLPACTAAGDVGKVAMYSKSSGATISQCVCKRTSSTYAWAGTHTGADCT